MAIEITGRAGVPTFIKTSPKADVEGGKKVAVSTTVKDDSVDLTSTNQEIKKAFSPSSATPVDFDRVNSVKKAVAEGSYSINAERTAKKLIQFEKLIPQENSS